MSTLFRAPATRWIPVVLWTTLIALESSALFSSSNTGGMLARVLSWIAPAITPDTVATINYVLRLLGHFLGFAALAFFWFRAVFPKLTPASAALVALFATACTAALDEWHQGSIATRTGKIGDVLLDTSGAMCALALCIWFYRRAGRTKTANMAAAESATAAEK